MVKEFNASFFETESFQKCFEDIAKNRGLTVEALK
jgi:hypothetical protein